MEIWFRLAYATTVPFGRYFGVFKKLEIVIANYSLVLMSATPFADSVSLLDRGFRFAVHESHRG